MRLKSIPFSPPDMTEAEVAEVSDARGGLRQGPVPKSLSI